MNAPTVFLIAGEPSGDCLGARFMAALKKQTGGEIRFAGVGGPLMEAEGLASLFPMSDLTLMGFVEVIPHIPRLRRRINECVLEARKLRPSVVLTIDSPGFNFRVARRLKGQGIPLIHYVAPSVWAWKPGRAGKIAKFLDHLLALLPFEPPYFEAEGLSCDFVGHPVLETPEGDGDAFRRRHGVGEDETLISILPGSRRGEIKRLLPEFGETIKLLSASRKLRVVVPVVDGLKADVAATVAEWPLPTLIVEGEQEKIDAFAASDVALAASGTVSLELAMAGVPMVIAYKVNPFTAWLARRLIKAKFVSLVNIVMSRLVVPEFLQQDCRPESLASAIETLLDDANTRNSQKSGVDEALKMMGRGGPSPSSRAAEAVLNIIRQQAP